MPTDVISELARLRELEYHARINGDLALANVYCEVARLLEIDQLPAAAAALRQLPRPPKDW